MPRFIFNIVHGAFNGVLMYLMSRLFLYLFGTFVVGSCFVDSSVCRLRPPKRCESKRDERDALPSVSAVGSGCSLSVSEAGLRRFVVQSTDTSTVLETSQLQNRRASSALDLQSWEDYHKLCHFYWVWFSLCEALRDEQLQRTVVLPSVPRGTWLLLAAWLLW